MGGFALCIENATRDIHSLLTLHRVHPQVHADVQRILGSLLRRQYTDMAVHYSPDIADSPVQVCRAVVESIIDQTVNTAIPATETRALERRCAVLEEEKDLLETEAAKSEAQLADVQTVLRNLKDAHDYMLHSYFREALTLRSRIDNLQRQNRAYRLHASAAASTAGIAHSSTVGAQLQQFVFNTATNSPSSSHGVREGAVSKRLGADEVLGSEAAAAAASGDASAMTPSSTSFNRNAKQDRTAPASQDTSPTRGLSETRRGYPPGEVPPGDSRGGNPQALSPAANAPPPPSSRGGTPSPGGKDRSVRIAPAFTTSSPARQMMTMQTTATYELVPAGDPESVDAIFDYEEYVRILNGKRGSWSKRYVAVMAEPDGGARRRRRSLKYRTRSFSDVLLRGSDGESVPGDMNASQHEGQQLQDAKMKGYRWLLHLALEPVQHKLKAELMQLRQAVCTMQKEHARDVQAISRALLHVQSRNDGLLDFLDTFVQETKRTVAVLARDSRAHTITDLLSSGALPAERADTIGTFFTPTPSPSLAAVSTGALPAPPPPLTLVAEMVGATAGTAAGGSGGSGVSPRAVSSHALHPRKEWRLKPDARLDAETRSAAMRAMDRRLQRPDVSKAPPISNTPPEEGNTAQYYRADLGLPYWNAHPITHHAQEIFGELQHVAKEMRVTRVQQLYAYEEAVALRGDGGRRVRFGKRNGSTASPSTERRSTTSQRARTGSQTMPMEKKEDSYYGPEDDADGTRPRMLLKEGWRSKTVVEGDGATGGDLLSELVHLRMRRACDQVRLARVQDTILHTFYPELAAQEDDPMGMLARRDQGGPAGRRWSFTNMPPIAFTSPEEVLKHRALQQVRTSAQKRIVTTSQRIAELQRLLAMHFAEHEVREVVDLSTVEAARRTAAEEAQGLYRVNGELRSTADLWNSPYLNDGRRVLYLPIGLDSTRDAEGNVGGGAGACVMLGDTPISMAPYHGTANAANTDRDYAADSLRRQTMRSGEDETNTAAEANVEPRNSPFVAVMEYCRGVQLGRPVGRRGGPVFLLQDAETGDYYVGDAEGRPLVTSASEQQGGAELAAAAATAAETRRPPLSMTRILFPAPLPAENTVEAAAAAGEDAVGGTANGTVPQASNAATALRPLYLVPMAVPLSDEEAVIRQGWQACHRHGHTRHDPIFSTDLSPLPLSASYHHVVPQRRDGGGLDVAVGGAGAASNKYVSDPPRVFQPADEAAAMVRVRALRLQTRSASDTLAWEASEAVGGGGGAALKGQPPTGAAAGALSVLSDSTNNGVTASPAETAAATTPPTSLRPLEPLRGSPTAAATTPYDAARSNSAKHGGAAAGGGWEAPPTSTSLSASAPGKMKGARGAGAASLAATTPAPGSASAMTAAVLVAKQQRAARLAQEAEAANHAKVQRQEAWQQRGETRVPTEKEAFWRLPHLSPLPAHSSETSALLPSAASSARLQRQMRPGKYALSPPPPASSRRSESAKRGSSEWNLDGDA